MSYLELILLLALDMFFLIRERTGGPLILPGTSAEEDVVVGIASWVTDCAEGRSEQDASLRLKLDVSTS